MFGMDSQRTVVLWLFFKRATSITDTLNGYKTTWNAFDNYLKICVHWNFASFFFVTAVNAAWKGQPFDLIFFVKPIFTVKPNIAHNNFASLLRIFTVYVSVLWFFFQNMNSKALTSFRYSGFSALQLFSTTKK